MWANMQLSFLVEVLLGLGLSVGLFRPFLVSPAELIVNFTLAITRQGLSGKISNNL